MPTANPAAWLPPLLIAIATFAVFFPVLGNGFVNWDDKANLLVNLHYRGLGWGNISWMFTTFHMGHYQPLSWLTFAVDYCIWQMEPFGYHLTSLLIHVLNAVVFFGLTRRLLGLAMPGERAQRLPVIAGAGTAALLFALHPLRVESVAWATERRDVLSALFYLLAIWAYVRAHEVRLAGSGAGRWMILAVMATVASLLAKSIAVTLVVVLVVLDIYPLRRLGGKVGWLGAATRPVWREKIPFLVPAVAMAIVAPIAQARAGALYTISQHSVGERAAQALYGLGFYVCKTVWPTGLSPLYELPADRSVVDARLVAAGVIILLAGAWLWRKRATRGPWISAWAAWSWYVVILTPVLGTFQSGTQMAADRYTYLACMGWAVLAGAGVTWSWGRLVGPRGGVRGRPVRTAAMAGILVIVVAVVLALAVRTRQQIGVWADSFRLWRHVLALDPYCQTARLNLGTLFLDAHQPEQAKAQFERALETYPDNAQLQANLGQALSQLGQDEAAQAAFRRALQLNRADDVALIGLGVLLAKQGKGDEAAKYLQTAVEVAPKSALAHAHYGRLLEQRGKLEAAIASYRSAVALDPLEWSFRDHLGLALVATRQYAEAEETFRRALADNSNDARPANALAWFLATCPDPRWRKGPEAVQLAEFACQITDREVPAFLDTLAVAYARVGRFDLAVQNEKRAIELARTVGNGDLVNRCESRLSLFEKQQPYASEQ